VVGSTLGDATSPESIAGLGLLALALVGCLALAATGHRGLFLLGWIGLMILLVPRELSRVSIVPLALAGGVLAASAVATIRTRVYARPTLRGVLGWSAAALGCAVLWPVIWTVLTDRDGFVALSSAERAPMAWARSATPLGSRFLIVTGRPWPRDRVSEWFPVLAERVSVVTPQGTEWTSDGRFGRIGDASGRAQECARSDASCIEAWERETGIPYDYLYLAVDPVRDCCGALARSLRAAPGYRLVYDDSAATIFQREGQ
jgi:hypothetical protein